VTSKFLLTAGRWDSYLSPARTPTVATKPRLTWATLSSGTYNFKNPSVHTHRSVTLTAKVGPEGPRRAIPRFYATPRSRYYYFTSEEEAWVDNTTPSWSKPRPACRLERYSIGSELRSSFRRFGHDGTIVYSRVLAKPITRHINDSRGPVRGRT